MFFLNCITINLPLYEKKADEFAFVCEKDGEFLGCVEIATYHIVDYKRPDDDIGVIGETYVKEECRGQSMISLKLLKMAIQKLMECGKFHAICHVQEDNEFRYLHFAMADGNIVDQTECKRKDGRETINYTLLIDLKKLIEEIEQDKFIRKVGKYHSKMSKSKKDEKII